MKIIKILIVIACTLGLTMTKSYAQDDYNYLALGDSITIHGIKDYWWQECGMAASTPEKDYVHLVSAYLKQSHSNVDTDIYNGDWGVSPDLLNQYYDHLTEMLKKKNYQLITIQYGINLRTDVGTADEFSKLVELCKEYAPSARIIIVGNFWAFTDFMKRIEEIKLQTAQKYGCGFANLTEAKENPAYQRGLGSTVYDAQGQPHIVENTGVAAHPNDEGMALIASKIEEQIDPNAPIDTNITKATPSLDKMTLDLYVGDTGSLSVTNPSGTITWEANNDNITLNQLSPSETQVIANKAGSSKIKVKLNGVASTCNVFVQERPMPDGWKTINNEKYYYLDGRWLKGVNLIKKKFYVFDQLGKYQAKKTNKLRKAVKKNAKAERLKKLFITDGAVYQTMKVKTTQVKMAKKQKKADKKIKKEKIEYKTWYFDGFEVRIKAQKEKKTVMSYKLTKHSDGFYKAGKYQYYYLKGKKLIGVHVIKNKFYVFDENGVYKKWRSQQLQSASQVNADAYKLKRLLKKYGAVYKYMTDLGYSCFGDGTDRVLYYTDFQISTLKQTTGPMTVEGFAAAR